MRFQGCHIKAWSGSLGAAFSVDEASVKEATVAYFFLADRSVDVSSLSVAQEGFLCALFLCENTPYWHSACLSCMVIASIAILLVC